MTQNASILAHLKARGSITTLEAFRDHRITRLAARCLELRQRGHKIEAEMVTVGNKRVARYRLK